jgi:DNA-binding PadR family transcriptional regulator
VSPRTPDAAPLTEVAWQILLALAEGPRHGYAILLDVEERTGGRLSLLPGSLYRALHRLSGQGWVRETEAPTLSAGGGRRHVFELTPAGRRAAEQETHRLAESVRTARERGLAAEGDPG